MAGTQRGSPYSYRRRSVFKRSKLLRWRDTKSAPHIPTGDNWSLSGQDYKVAGHKEAPHIPSGDNRSLSGQIYKVVGHKEAPHIPSGDDRSLSSQN